MCVVLGSAWLVALASYNRVVGYLTSPYCSALLAQRLIYSRGPERREEHGILYDVSNDSADNIQAKQTNKQTNTHTHKHTHTHTHGLLTSLCICLG